MSIFWVSHCFIINFLQKYWVETISVGLFCSLFPGWYAVYYFPSFAVSSVCCPGLTGKEPLWHLLVQQGTDAIRADKLPWATSLLVWATQALPVSSCHFCVPRSLLPHRQPWSFSPMQSEVWFLEDFWIWIPGCGKAAGISAISGRVRVYHHSVITLLFRHLEADGGEIPLHQDCAYCFSYMLCLVLPLCKRRKIVGNWKT